MMLVVPGDASKSWGGNLPGSPVIAADDRPESVRVRMAAYEKSTSPLTDFYRRKGLLVPIVAEGTPEEIFERTLTALENRKG